MAATLSAIEQRQTATINHKLSVMWEMKPNTISQKTSGFLRGTEQVKRPEILQVL
jgi:hypothetical protein